MGRVSLAPSRDEEASRRRRRGGPRAAHAAALALREARPLAAPALRVARRSRQAPAEGRARRARCGRARRVRRTREGRPARVPARAQRGVRRGGEGWRGDRRAGAAARARREGLHDGRLREGAEALGAARVSRPNASRSSMTSPNRRSLVETGLPASPNRRSLVETGMPASPNRRSNLYFQSYGTGARLRRLCSEPLFHARRSARGAPGGSSSWKERPEQRT